MICYHEGRHKRKGIDDGMSTRTTATVNLGRNGVAFGTVLAVVISWSIHQSILWAILHGLFGWFYVVYYAIMR